MVVDHELGPVSDAVQAAIEAYEAGRAAQGLGALRALTEAYPNEPLAAQAMGTALCNVGEFAEAVKVLTHAVHLAPEHAVSRAYLGLALLLSTYDVQEAGSQMEQAVALGPQSFLVRWKYGEFLLRLGYAREAAAELQIALRLDAPNAGSRATCGEMLRVAEKRAVGQYNRAAPSFPPAFLRNLWQWLLSHTKTRRAAAEEA